MKKIIQILRQFILPLLPPLCVAVLIVVQQIYYPNTRTIILVNIIMLVFNLLEFAPLLIDKTLNSALHLICIGFIVIMACLFNIIVGGTPTPFFDFRSFFDSLCGLWIVLFIVELIVFGLCSFKQKNVISTERTYINFDDGEKPSINHAGNISHKEPSEGTEGLKRSNQDTLKLMAKLLIGYFIVILFLPFANWKNFEQSKWLQSVRAIDKLIYGKEGITRSIPGELFLYMLGLFVVFIALIVGLTVVKYALAKYIANDTQNDFFDQYSTPIVVLAIAGAVILTIRQENANPDGNDFNFENITGLLGYVSSLFSYMIAIIVAIIALLVAFETIRLVLKQCTKPGSLLKGAMQLIFILIVQYTMGLLMGLLQIFALRGVIESLLLFFLPDLDQSIEPEVKQVLDLGLKNEVRQASDNMEVVKIKRTHQKARPSGYRIIKKRRRKK